MYAGGTTSGLRINGNDYGNTIYQDAVTIGGQPANIGFTLRNTNTFNFYSLVSGVGYVNIMNMNTSGISLNKNTTCVGTLNVSGSTTLNNAATCLSTLNVVGNVNASGLSVFTMNSNIDNLNNTSTTIFNNLYSLSTFSKLNIHNLNNTSTTINML
jgi:hypothetical protein